MKICAITKSKCDRYGSEKTKQFCDTCPVAEAKESYDVLMKRLESNNG